MARETIDFGVDLGTTNSSIAVMTDTGPEVFRNNEGFEYTPSAAWIDKKNNLFVGRRAKERLEDDYENAAGEFKLQMGTQQERVFARSGRRMKPEELSAEVLKSLKADVRQNSGEEIQAAVITVPAAFELPQCEATNRAAQLAGFSQSPLFMEPVAAALAYGFNSQQDNVFWLVYDFGGGTFDAAVIQVRDGAIQVVNHEGDNHLGGKLIDWAIVDELLIPAAIQERRLTDFRRGGNNKWIGAIAKLKQHAEEAKIRVSRDNSAEIIIEFLCQDDRGDAVRFEYELKRADLERLAEPFVRRSINICKKVLVDKRLSPANMEKLILVGGPTLTPYFRERLEDKGEGLGIPLEFRVDPLTVVSRGAAIFSRTQRVTGIEPETVRPGQFALQLEYKPVGPDTEPLLGGRVMSRETKDFSGFHIEFIRPAGHPPYRSGRIGLGRDGSFMINLLAEKGPANTFMIELYDAKGNKCETVPDRIRYTVGQVITDPPLIHSVGVAMANNEMDILLEKGIALPARRRSIHRTVVDVRKGQEGGLIRIPVVEGENRQKADRNSLIGRLEIEASQVRRDVPAGSEVEITIEINESRLLRTKAYIPLLDEEFEHVVILGKLEPKTEDLNRDFEEQKKRLEAARGKARSTGSMAAQEKLARIDDEQMVHDVEASLAASGIDRDAADKCQNRLRDLKSAIDEIEDALEWPALLAEAEEAIKNTGDVVREHGDNADRQKFAAMEGEIRRTMGHAVRDPDVLRRGIGEIQSLSFQILRQKPGFWIGWLNHLESMKSEMRDQTQAEQYFAQGRRAINNNDVPALVSAVQQLFGLLPVERARQAGLYGGTTQKG